MRQKGLIWFRQLALVYLHLALHHVKLFQYKKALAHFRLGFSLVEELDDARNQGRILECLRTLSYDEGRIQESGDLF